jgi:hypothetical protein
VTGNTISIQLTNIKKGNYSWQLFNGSGQLLRVKNIQYNGGDTKEQIELDEQFIIGKYDLRLTGEGIWLNAPVIKK